MFCIIVREKPEEEKVIYDFTFKEDAKDYLLENEWVKPEFGETWIKSIEGCLFMARIVVGQKK